jgi:threonine aldolase
VISFYDTSTLPTPAMLEAMATAELGDDVYQQDPTVNALEALAAQTLGKEAALFVPSGTMANLVALMVHTSPGEEVIVEAESHILYYESGGLAALAGLMPLPVAGVEGVLSRELVEPHLRKPNLHYPRTTLLCVENTHNRAGGSVTTPAAMRELRALCDERGLRMHVDGARLLNAAVALDVPVTALAADADSVTIALSKALCAPVGSVLAGDASFVDEARRRRKLLGGGMRQAGVLAAAGIVALRDGVARLAEDHARARRLADALRRLPGIDVANRVETNMVLIDCAASGLTADQLVAALKDRGIRSSSRPPSLVRFVTHRWIGDAEVDSLVHALEAVVTKA